MTSLLSNPPPWPHGMALEWAERRGWQTFSSEGVLAIRPLVYWIDNPAGSPQGTTPPNGGSIEGLRIRAHQHDELPIWHRASGIYGFLHLPEGAVSIEITDPQKRYLPSVIHVNPADIERRVVEVLMRPALGSGLPPGCTAIWGLISWKGLTIPNVLLRITTAYTHSLRTMTTLSAEDGSYLLPLRGEMTDQLRTPPGRKFSRTLEVYALTSKLTDELIRQWRENYIDSIPANLDLLISSYDDGTTSTIHAQDSLPFRLGEAQPAASGEVSITIGEKIRWDIELPA